MHHAMIPLSTRLADSLVIHPAYWIPFMAFFADSEVLGIFQKTSDFALNCRNRKIRWKIPYWNPDRDGIRRTIPSNGQHRN